MKTIKNLLVLVMMMFIVNAQAQKVNPRKTEVTVKTTVECALCKKNLESKLIKYKGVRKVTADFTKKEVVVIYNSKRVTLDEIKKAIADIGYDADDVPANNKMSKILQHKQQQQGSSN